MSTKIQWTDETWNPVTGCTKISPGCANCYAERMAKRLTGRCGYPAAPNQFDVRLHPNRLDQPLSWRKPRMCFVCSMSDLFHEEVSDDFVLRVFAAIALSRKHTFQVLTKRPRRMAEFAQRIQGQAEYDNDVEYYASELAVRWGAHEHAESLGGTYQAGQYGDEGRCEIAPAYEGMSIPWPLPHVWIGVTAEDQKRADERIPLLLDTPAAVRFVSVEPMLGSIDLDDFWGAKPGWGEPEGIDWVIIGCESGPHRRPMQIEWALDLVRQCKAAGVPVFVKQLSINGKVNHNPDEWPEELRVREYPSVEAKA